MKIQHECWSWGMRYVSDQVNEAVKILNRKDWTAKEKIVIEHMLNDIEDVMKDLKGEAWGEDV